MFGCFSLLVISDFGGLRRPRAIAYLTATIVGAALVALGTLVSSSAWLAAVVMLLVGFAISFSRTFGGYVAAANIGMLLAFVIAVTIPGSADVIPARVGGWAIAGLISTGAAVALWPLFERVTTHNQAAKALLAVADLVEGMRSAAGDSDLPRLEEAARHKGQVAGLLTVVSSEATLRVVWSLGGAGGRNAIAGAGARPGVGESVVQVLQLIGTHLESPSTVRPRSLRVAIGLAVAVWVARRFD